jgi:hypothetical protein
MKRGQFFRDCFLGDWLLFVFQKDACPHDR